MYEIEAAVGQADDFALVANDINQLQLLLQLTLSYCETYQVQLSVEKTKLLAFSKPTSEYMEYSNMFC